MKPTQLVLVLCALGALALAAIVGLVPFGQAPSARVPIASSPALSLPTKTVSGSVVEALAFLPSGFAQDGSVDYTSSLQAAIDAASGKTLLLPPFPVQVARKPGKNYCLLVLRPMRITGTPSSVLTETQGGVQILRAEGVDGLELSGFTVRGKGGTGHNLAHGLVQITGGAHITVDSVQAFDSDADGIAIANAAQPVMRNCRAERCSKAALYVNNCDGAIVSGNTVRDSGGHIVGSAVVGAAFQISSCRNAIVEGNQIDKITGIGIKCDALAAGSKPFGCVLRGNRITNCKNPTNIDVSSGIRLDNAFPDEATATLVEGNSIQGCGRYGIYVENHGAAMIANNLVLESEGSAIVVSSAAEVVLRGNTIVNSDTSLANSQAAIYLLNNASGVLVRDNAILKSPLYQASGGIQGTYNGVPQGGNALEPRLRYESGPPLSGTWSAGDLFFNSAPAPGGSVGWVCTASGTPGVWVPFGAL